MSATPATAGTAPGATWERIEPGRIEEAGLKALQTQRPLFYDGWLLRLSPGEAKRARSVNPHFGSTLPLDDKIDHCERLFNSPLQSRFVVIEVGGEPVSTAQMAIDARAWECQ